jgi:hypothetical protein
MGRENLDKKSKIYRARPIFIFPAGGGNPGNPGSRKQANRIVTSCTKKILEIYRYRVIGEATNFQDLQDLAKRENHLK